jgi:hypothetical protein
MLTALLTAGIFVLEPLFGLRHFELGRTRRGKMSGLCPSDNHREGKKPAHNLGGERAGFILVR